MSSLVRVTTRREPSGDQAGALVLPRKAAITRVVPCARFCTTTTGFFWSKET
jgi:hypothetical protein